MANYGILGKSYILFNSVAFAGKVTKALLTLGKDVIDISVFGALAKIKTAGLEDHKLDIEVMGDMSAPGAGATFNTLLAAWVGGIPVAVNYRVDDGAIATTNPEFQCSYLLASMPIGGTFGEYYKISVSLISSGVMTIDTTP
jgi:hypothetical protein